MTFDADGPIRIIQIVAHMDLHAADAGMDFSRASVMRNVVKNISGVAPLVQIGVRDTTERERRYAEACCGRVVTLYDTDLWRARDAFDAHSAARVLDTIFAAPAPSNGWITAPVEHRRAARPTSPTR